MKTQIVIFLLLLPVLFLGGCAKKSTPTPGNQTQALSAPNVSPVVSVTPRSDRVPNFSWKDSTGKVIDLDRFRGSGVMLINFWATWCGPCKKELPDLVAISREMASRNVKVIGISTDRGSSAVQDVAAFVSEHGIPYQIVVSNDDLESAFGNIRAIPTSFVVDPQGKIVETLVGGRSKEMFVQILTAAMK